MLHAVYIERGVDAATSRHHRRHDDMGGGRGARVYGRHSVFKCSYIAIVVLVLDFGQSIRWYP